MSFRDDQQIARAARSLLIVTGQAAELWTEDGPTALAVQYRDDGAPFGSGGVVLSRLAWDIWNDSGKVTISDLLSTLDTKNLRAVGELLTAVAAGGAAVDAWIAQREAQETSASSPALETSGTELPEVSILRAALQGVVSTHEIMMEHAPPGVALLANGWFAESIEEARRVLGQALGGTR